MAKSVYNTIADNEIKPIVKNMQWISFINYGENTAYITSYEDDGETEASVTPLYPGHPLPLSEIRNWEDWNAFSINATGTYVVALHDKKNEQ